MVAASWAPWWSSSSFWNSLRALQWAAAMSALLLTVGAAVEYWEKLKHIVRIFAKWVVGKSTAYDRCVLKKLVIHSLGPILVLVGIGGDFVFGGRTFILEDRQEENAQRIVGSLQSKADSVSNEADALRTRLDTASRQMGILEKAIASEGPRAKLLIAAAPQLVKELSPFAGQRVGLYVCGQQGEAEQETMDAWGAIANILDSDTVSGITGAKWKEVPTNLNWTGNCGAAKGLGQGVAVFVSKDASKKTMAAAVALSRGLATVLPPSPNKMLMSEDPAFRKLVVNRGFQTKDAPWNIVAYDPDLVTVMLGEHP